MSWPAGALLVLTGGRIVSWPAVALLVLTGGRIVSWPAVVLLVLTAGASHPACGGAGLAWQLESHAEQGLLL